jgi:hypothetical protein
MYNTEAFGDTPPTSWDVVFEEMTLPDGESNQGRVQAYDGPIYIADAALYLMYHQPELGITDPYALNRDQFNAALDLLRTQRTLVNRYWHDAYIQMDDFKNEGVVASGSWPFQVNVLEFEGQPISSVFPVEGATGWSDSTMMHIDAPHPNCAYKWLEHSLSPKLQGDLAAWFGSVPAVPAACTGNALLTDAGCATNGFDKFDQIHFWRTPVADCGNGSKTACLSGTLIRKRHRWTLTHPLGCRAPRHPPHAFCPLSTPALWATHSCCALHARHPHFGDVKVVDCVARHSMASSSPCSGHPARQDHLPAPGGGFDCPPAACAARRRCDAPPALRERCKCLSRLRPLPHMTWRQRGYGRLKCR